MREAGIGHDRREADEVDDLVAAPQPAFDAAHAGFHIAYDDVAHISEDALTRHARLLPPCASTRIEPTFGRHNAQIQKWWSAYE